MGATSSKAHKKSKKTSTSTKPTSEASECDVLYSMTFPFFFGADINHLVSIEMTKEEDPNHNNNNNTNNNKSNNYYNAMEKLTFINQKSGGSVFNDDVLCIIFGMIRSIFFLGKASQVCQR